MTEGLREIGAAIPLGGPRRVGRIAARLEEQHVPTSNQGPDGKRKRHAVLRRRVVHGLQGTQIGVDRVHVMVRQLGVGGVRESRVEMRAIGCEPLAHGALELRLRPGADPGHRVRGDICRVDHAKWRMQRPPAGEGCAVRPCMAGDAIPGNDQIAALARCSRCRASAGCAESAAQTPPQLKPMSRAPKAASRVDVELHASTTARPRARTWHPGRRRGRRRASEPLGSTPRSTLPICCRS